MGTGSLFQGEDAYSPTRLNHKTILIDTAAVIEAISDPLEGQVAVPTTDGVTLKKFRVYCWDELNSEWLDQSNPEHAHDGDETGGTLKDIEIANSTKIFRCSETDLIYQVSNGTSPTYSNTVSGTDAYRQITTAASTNSAGNYSRGGLLYDFAYPIFMQFIAQFSTVLTEVTTRIGANMEFSHVSSNAAIKIGVEACDSCNAEDLRVVSANGVTRSATNTTDQMDEIAGYKLLYTPATSLVYTKDNGTAVTKTSHIPSSGTPDRSNTIIAGILTTDTNAKSLRLKALKAFATPSGDSNKWV